VHAGHWLNGSFALANAAFLLYALVRLVGLREVGEDLRPLVTRAAQAVSTMRVAHTSRRLAAN
jgi:hypothetical protein